MITKILAPLACLGLAIGLAFSASEAKKPRILFFSKSSGFEHSVISWKNGQPSHAEKTLLELGAKQGWDFEFSKDGSKFSKDYLAQFDAVFFYTTGNLLEAGTDKNPPMTAEGKQALFDFVKAGKGFIGTHSASDTFHTDNEAVKGPERYLNHGEKADPYVRFLGAEFIIHGAQQVAKNTVINPAFPGFESIGTDFAFQEEWYSLKDFRDDIHVLTTIDAPAMEGSMYGRPAYPSTWARKEGEGRVWYTAMGHREDVWTNPIFQKILIGGIHWALGTVNADVPPNLAVAAPGAGSNPPYVPQKPKAPAKSKPVTETKAK
ncbi:MAG: ThuA domain-containing protein [Verrucomicrobia bacterium]|nr:ThuA domain-containing protein [Verrucomicrobiota bacterium]